MTDGLIAYVDFFDVTQGSYAKNSTYVDACEKEFTFESASTVTADGYLNGKIRWEKILPEESDYTVQITASLNNTSETRTDFATLGLQKYQFYISSTDLVIRADASAWRAQNTCKYDEFVYTSSMYGYTNLPFAAATEDAVQGVITATFDVTPKDFYYSQTRADGYDWYEKEGVKYVLDSEGKTVSTSAVSGGFVGLTEAEYNAFYRNTKPGATELYWYADGADATYVKDVPENPIQEEGQVKYGPGIGNGYFMSVTYTNGEEVSGTRMTMPYILSATVGETLAVGLVAETYGAVEVTPQNAQMFIIDGGEGLSYDAVTDTVTTSKAGDYTVVFRIPFTIGTSTVYIFTQPIVITAK